MPAVCDFVSWDKTMPPRAAAGGGGGGGVEAGERELQLLRRAHRIPVARPQVGAEHHEAARLHALEQGGRGRKAWEAEEQRARLRAGVAIDRALDRRDAAVDLGVGGRDAL